MVKDNCGNAREVERRAREELEQEKKTWSDKGVHWSPPAAQTSTVEVQRKAEKKEIEMPQEKMMEKKSKREKGKGKKTAKDSKPTEIAPLVTHEDT